MNTYKVTEALTTENVCLQCRSLPHFDLAVSETSQYSRVLPYRRESLRSGRMSQARSLKSTLKESKTFQRRQTSRVEICPRQDYLGATPALFRVLIPGRKLRRAWPSIVAKRLMMSPQGSCCQSSHGDEFPAEEVTGPQGLRRWPWYKMRVVAAS